MGKYVDAAPEPKSHVKTLMRIGYDMSSAIADILDNSITAGSKHIDIFSPPNAEDPIISVLDDGCGMSREELVQNMRIGCKDPDEVREKGDLGRFGSGMKTASFSQARRLTVVTKKMGNDAVAAVWDIDKIESENAWCLEILEGHDLKRINYVKIDNSCDQGTQIIWEKITRLQRKNHSLEPHVELAATLSEIRKHISLYFHRFLVGAKKVSISINKTPIEPIDPFLTKSDGYQEGRSERLRCKGGFIEIKTHVLPPFNRMDKQALKELGGSTAVVSRQGLYIYREKRLINAGGWMGLANISQLSALARIQVDIPSSLDNDWS